MFWWGLNGSWGWVAGLLTALLWIGIIVAAVILLRRELPALQNRVRVPPALTLLEERYARGEITREEFLYRREVLLTPDMPTHRPATPAPPESGPSDFEQPSPPPRSDQDGAALSSTYEPPSDEPRPAETPPEPGADPTQPLPPAPPG